MIGLSTGSFTRLGPGLYQVDLSVNFNNTRYASGIEKLCFEFLYCLLTSAGSIYGMPSFGTNFRSLIGQLSLGGNVSNVEMVVQQEIMSAEAQVLNGQDGYSLTDDERLNSVDVSTVELDSANQRVSITMRITNALGQSVGFIIPMGVQ